MESAPRDATSSSSSTSRSVAGDLVSVALPSLSRYAGSGAAMLRNGGAAVRHYADVARGGRGARPSSWSPGLTIGVELLSGFLEGIDLRPSEVDALLAGEGDDLVAYVRSLRAVMAVGIPPLPGTRVEPVRIRWGDARHSAAWLTPPRRETRDGTRPVILWLHGGAFILCGTSTHARLLSSVAHAADARVLSVEYPLAPDQGGYVDALRAATDAYRWLVDDAGGGVDPRDVVVGGDSAGGHLALGLVRELATARGCGVGPDGASTRAGRVEMPAGVVLMSPWLDPGRRLDETVAAWEEAASSSVDYLRGVKDSMEAVERLVFGDETDETESSPPRCLLDADLWTRAGRHATLPPVLVQCGGAEVLAGESRAFGAAAKDAGWSDVEVQEWVDMPHVFQVFDAVASEGEEAIRSAGAFAARVTAR